MLDIYIHVEVSDFKFSQNVVSYIITFCDRVVIFNNRLRFIVYSYNPRLCIPNLFTIQIIFNGWYVWNINEIELSIFYFF